MVCFPHIIARLYAWGIVASGSTPVDARSQLECMGLCTNNSTCSSFFFQEKTSSCYLHERWIKHLSPDPQSGGMDYFVMYPDSCQFHDNQFVRKGNMCLKFIIEQKSWPEASEACMLEGARLVKIDKEEKMAAIFNILDSEYKDYEFIIGLHDPYQNDTWQWIDGSALTYTWWAPGEPNPKRDELCVHLSLRHYGWIDVVCTRNANYICEKNIGS